MDNPYLYAQLTAQLGIEKSITQERINMQFTLPINLDDMSVDPQDYADFTKWLARQVNYRIGNESRKILISYADKKAMAIQHRLAGMTMLAEYFETRCTEIYKRLPKKWRW